jgi:iron complex outermembrane receptor protein
MPKNKSCSLLLSVGAYLLLPNSLALGQEARSTGSVAQDTSATPDDSGLADVIVTAEKRPSVAQRTAISLAVIDSETLKSQGVGSVADLTTLTPSVSFAENGASSIITIRGVSSRDTNQLGDPAVSISVDGFYLQRSLGLNATLFDLERVEALRGPQGTLLGRNATGGALNIITAKPTDSFAASATAEAGNYNTYDTQGFVNLPINDVIKVRAAFQTRDHDGYRDNAPSRNGDDEHSKAARLSVLLDPTSRWSLLLTGEFARQDEVGPVIDAVPWRYLNGSTTNVDYSRPPIPGDGLSFPIAPGSTYTTQSTNFRWNTSYDMDFATLTYLGGFRVFDFYRLSTLGAQYGTPRQNYSFDQREHPKSWDHELRITSRQDVPFLWQAGLFYFQEANSTQSLFQDYPGSPGLIGTPVSLQIFRKPDLLLKSDAAFGQVSYALTDQLRIEAGGRYSQDDKHNFNATNLATNVANYITGGPSTIAYVANPPKATHISSNKTTYHGALNYDWTPHNLLYVKYDTGYKAGGFTDLNPYGPESLTAYEVGSKNRFFGNHLQINSSAFLYNYRDQQVQEQITLPTGGIGTGTVNAGKSRIYGGDLDAIFQMTHADRIDGYVAYLHARFTDFLTALNGVNVQLAGNTLQQAPSWVGNFGYEHQWGMGSGTLTARAQTHLESDSYFTFYNYDADRQRSYHRSDLLLTYRAPNDRWLVEAYVHNLENALILSFADPTGSTYQTYRYQFQPPRTYGGRVTVNF